MGFRFPVSLSAILFTVFFWLPLYAEESVPDTIVYERIWSSPARLSPEVLNGYDSSRSREIFDRALFRRAVERYLHVQNQALELENEIRKIRSSRDILRESRLWEIQESLERIEKHARKIKREYHSRMAEELEEILRDLDRIESGEIRKDPAFDRFYRIVLRIMAVFLTEAGESAGAVNALDAYLRHGGGEEEWPLHYFYAINYESLFRMARKNRSAGEKDLLVLRKIRSEHLLKFVELRYGVDSRAYSTTRQKLDGESMGSPFPGVLR